MHQATVPYKQKNLTFQALEQFLIFGLPQNRFLRVNLTPEVQRFTALFVVFTYDPKGIAAIEAFHYLFPLLGKSSHDLKYAGMDHRHGRCP